MARSDSRLTLITKLMRLNIGFNEVKSYAEDLNLKLRTDKMRGGGKTDRKLVREAMRIKLRDELILTRKQNLK